MTTDLGSRDHYAAILKGAILSKRPETRLIDVSHHIHSFDIVHAAYVVQNAFRGFPKGSVHIVTVDNTARADLSYLCLVYDGHRFIVPDNGMASLLFPDERLVCRRFDLSVLNGAQQAQKIAWMLDQLLAVVDLAELGLPADDVTQRIGLQAVIQSDRINAAVMHVDHFGNLILNVQRPLFDQVGKGRSFALYFKRFDPIQVLSTYYDDVPVGETLCRFNDSGYLEIAIHMGRAADLLGLQIDDTIQIEFLPNE
ncbi:MAG: SAM-dependent chlorinase/fluorinase [Bacteroidota bacterium]